MKRLLDYCSVSGKNVPPFDGIKKYVATGDVINNRITSYENVDYKNKPSRANQIADSNEVLFAKMKDTKKVLLINEKTAKNIYSTGFFVIKANLNVLPEYLYWLFNSKKFNQDKDKNSKGATQKAINLEGLGKIMIKEIPSLDKQKEIINKINSCNEIIELKKEQLDELEKLIKSQFVEMFGDPINNQKGFPLIKVGDVFEFEGGSQPDKKYFEYQPSEDNIRLIQIRDYKSNDYITYIPKEKAKRFCTANDIMIGRYGPPIFQILKGIEGAYNVALMKAVPKKGNIEFLRQFLKQECLLHYLEGLSGRTAGQAGIEMPKLKNYPFPYPPLELQNQFANFVEHIDKLEFEQKKVCPVCE